MARRGYSSISPKIIRRSRLAQSSQSMSERKISGSSRRWAIGMLHRPDTCASCFTSNIELHTCSRTTRASIFLGSFKARWTSVDISSNDT